MKKKITPKEKVLSILETFGMTPKKAAQIMGITYDTFHKKKNENIKHHSFNEKNATKLIDYIKEHSEKI